MRLYRTVRFDVPTTLSTDMARIFIRDVAGSLKHAAFLEDVTVRNQVVSANLPINAALFGQQRLRFESIITETEQGARLEGLSLNDKPGWASVGGSAWVQSTPAGNSLAYTFEIDIHLTLPTATRWGGRALMKMIEVTADRVLENVCEAFPAALTNAARAYEASLAA